MNNLEKQYLIKRENLIEEHYFQSILQEAHSINLITDSDLENIQLQIVQLLARQTELYTGGESSSITVETGKNIMLSLFYTIGIYLKSLPDTDLSIMELKQNPLSELYKKGAKLIDRKISCAKIMLGKLQKNSIDTDNLAYNDTLEKGLPLFFSSYNTDFGTHETLASIDYPLANDTMDFVGIEYICNYLDKFMLENQFCQSFSSSDINSLLQGYDNQYQDLLINIFEIALTNALGCILANKNPILLNLEKTDLDYLQQNLKNLSENELCALLQSASSKLFTQLDITNKSLQEYILFTIKNISASLKNALENQQLKLVFISFKEDNTQSDIQFQDGDKLDDELFRDITDEILECCSVSEKIEIIQNKIHSIVDLVDIFEADCVFDEEFIEVFSSIGNTELALLLKRLPLNTQNDNFDFIEIQEEWQTKLIDYLNQIDLNRKNLIKKLSKKINLG